MWRSENNFIFHQLRVGGCCCEWVRNTTFPFLNRQHHCMLLPSVRQWMHNKLTWTHHSSHDRVEFFLPSSPSPLNLGKYLYRLNIKKKFAQNGWRNGFEFFEQTTFCQVSADTKKLFFYPFSFCGAAAAEWTKKVESSSSMLTCVCCAAAGCLSQAKSHFTEILHSRPCWVCVRYREREKREKRIEIEWFGVADFDFEKWERGCECN